MSSCARRAHFGLLVLALAIPIDLRAASVSATFQLPERVRQADDFFLGRQTLENVRKGLGLLRAEAAADPQNYQVWWRISKFLNYLARHTDDDEEELRLLEDGIVAGRRAVALGLNQVEGHFWLGANLGTSAEEHGLIEGLRHVDEIRREMETVMRLDPNYEQAAGMRTLARVYYRCPFFKGGDKRRSILLLEKCLQHFPEDSLAWLYLADSYEAIGRREDARRALERILNLCPDPCYGPELADNQAEARVRLAHDFHEGK